MLAPVCPSARRSRKRGLDLSVSCLPTLPPHKKQKISHIHNHSNAMDYSEESGSSSSPPYFPHIHNSPLTPTPPQFQIPPQHRHICILLGKPRESYPTIHTFSNAPECPSRTRLRWQNRSKILSNDTNKSLNNKHVSCMSTNAGLISPLLSGGITPLHSHTHTLAAAQSTNIGGIRDNSEFSNSEWGDDSERSITPHSDDCNNNDTNSNIDTSSTIDNGNHGDSPVITATSADINKQLDLAVDYLTACINCVGKRSDQLPRQKDLFSWLDKRKKSHISKPAVKDARNLLVEWSVLRYKNSNRISKKFKHIHDAVLWLRQHKTTASVTHEIISDIDTQSTPMDFDKVMKDIISPSLPTLILPSSVAQATASIPNTITTLTVTTTTQIPSRTTSQCHHRRQQTPPPPLYPINTVTSPTQRPITNQETILLPLSMPTTQNNISCGGDDVNVLKAWNMSDGPLSTPAAVTALRIPVPIVLGPTESPILTVPRLSPPHSSPIPPQPQSQLSTQINGKSSTNDHKNIVITTTIPIPKVISPKLVSSSSPAKPAPPTTFIPKSPIANSQSSAKQQLLRDTPQRVYRDRSDHITSVKERRKSSRSPLSSSSLKPNSKSLVPTKLATKPQRKIIRSPSPVKLKTNKKHLFKKSDVSDINHTPRMVIKTSRIGNHSNPTVTVATIPTPSSLPSRKRIITSHSKKISSSSSSLSSSAVVSSSAATAATDSDLMIIPQQPKIRHIRRDSSRDKTRDRDHRDRDRDRDRDRLSSSSKPTSILIPSMKKRKIAHSGGGNVHFPPVSGLN